MKQIPGFPKYLISREGKVSREGKILKLDKVRSGYLRVRLSDREMSKTFSVHRLVAQAYITNPDNKPCINHKDGDKTNNSVENLEWCTHQENAAHSLAMGLYRVEKKPCLRCGKEDYFSGNKVYCGSVRPRVGCAGIVDKEKGRIRQMRSDRKRRSVPLDPRTWCQLSELERPRRSPEGNTPRCADSHCIFCRPPTN